MKCQFCKGSRIPEKGIRIKIRSFWQIFPGPLYTSVFRAQQTVTENKDTSICPRETAQTYQGIQFEFYIQCSQN